MNKERSFEEDWKTVMESTPGEWYYQENDDVWQLFGGEYGHMQLIKAPKHGTNYAEYWPEMEDAKLMCMAREALIYYMEKYKKLEENGVAIHIKPGDKVDVVNEWQFPVLVKANREKWEIEGDAILDHVRIHSFGLYAKIRFDNETYTIPYNRVIKVD